MSAHAGVCARHCDEEVRMITEFIIQRAPSENLMHHNEEVRTITECIVQRAPSRKLMQHNEEMRAYDTELSY